MGERCELRKLEATTAAGTDGDAPRQLRVDDNPGPPSIDLWFDPGFVCQEEQAVAGKHGLEVRHHTARVATAPLPHPTGDGEPVVRRGAPPLLKLRRR